MNDILQYMFHDGFLTAKEVVALRKTCRELQESPVRILRSLNIAKPEEIQAYIQRTYRIPSVTDKLVDSLDESFKALIPIDLAINYGVFAVAETENSIHVAMEDPSDKTIVHRLEFFLERKVIPVAANVYQIVAALMKLYEISIEQIKLTTILESSRGVVGGSRTKQQLLQAISDGNDSEVDGAEETTLLGENNNASSDEQSSLSSGIDGLESASKEEKNIANLSSRAANTFDDTPAIDGIDSPAMESIDTPAMSDADFASMANSATLFDEPASEQTNRTETDPFAAAADPLAAEADPFATGADPLATGADPLTADADPFSAESEQATTLDNNSPVAASNVQPELPSIDSVADIANSAMPDLDVGDVVFFDAPVAPTPEKKKENIGPGDTVFFDTDEEKPATSTQKLDNMGPGDTVFFDTDEEKPATSAQKLDNIGPGDTVFFDADEEKPNPSAKELENIGPGDTLFFDTENDKAKAPPPKKAEPEAVETIFFDVNIEPDKEEEPDSLPEMENVGPGDLVFFDSPNEKKKTSTPKAETVKPGDAVFFSDDEPSMEATPEKSELLAPPASPLETETMGIEDISLEDDLNLEPKLDIEIDSQENVSSESQPIELKSGKGVIFEKDKYKTKKSYENEELEFEFASFETAPELNIEPSPKSKEIPPKEATPKEAKPMEASPKVGTKNATEKRIELDAEEIANFTSTINATLVKLALVFDINKAVALLNEKTAQFDIKLSITDSNKFKVTIKEITYVGDLKNVQPIDNGYFEALAPALKRLGKICR